VSERRYDESDERAAEEDAALGGTDVREDVPDRPRHGEPNPTQERIGSGEEQPADVSWSEDDWGLTPAERPPHDEET
jgi:hypothetical protein